MLLIIPKITALPIFYIHGTKSQIRQTKKDVLELLSFSASVIQGSAIGPASYVVTAGDLCSVTPGNTLCKYADDTYIIIPGSNAHSRVAELDNVEAWACRNNLQLNRSKSVEIVSAVANIKYRLEHGAECTA